MLTLITDAKKIRSATKEFRAQLAAATGKPVRHMVGFPGGSEMARVWVLRRHRFFWCLLADGDSGNRCWNGFGHVMPGEASVLPLDVEVNMPWEGIDRRIAGAFLEGPRGETYVGHRGKIGGGRKGVGKTAFWARYRAQAQPVMDDEPVVVLGRIGSPKLLVDLGTFVHTVADIKREATGGDSADGEHGDPDFTPEFEGTKSVEVSRRIEAQCHHGTIVRQLRDALGALGWKAGNDRARDLVARRGSGRPVTFEVKTDSSSQSVFTGVGQLVMHARPMATGDAAVLVLPADLPPRTEKALAAEGIQVLRFRWADDVTIEFDRLASLVASVTT